MLPGQKFASSSNAAATDLTSPTSLTTPPVQLRRPLSPDATGINQLRSDSFPPHTATLTSKTHLSKHAVDVRTELPAPCMRHCSLLLTSPKIELRHMYPWSLASWLCRWSDLRSSVSTAPKYRLIRPHTESSPSLDGAQRTWRSPCERRRLT